jgi:hypothetical protein
MPFFEITAMKRAYNTASRFVHPARPARDTGLHPKLPKHEKVRFRRAEISRLDRLPSAFGPTLPRHGSRFWRLRRLYFWRRVFRRTLVAVGVLALLLAVLFAGINLFGASEFGADRLREAAERALTDMVGVGVDASIGRTSISLDSSHFVALQVADVRLSTHGAGKPVIDAGRVRFGIRFLPLLTGHVRLGSAMIEDATIRPGLMPDMGGADWTARLRDSRGLIDPDHVLDAAFGLFRHAFDAVNAGSTRVIELHRVKVAMPDSAMPQGIRIEDVRVSRSLTGALDLSGQLHALGMDFTLDAVARRSAAGGIAGLKLDVAAERPRPMAVNEEEAGAGQGVSLDAVGAFKLTVTGAEAAGDRPARLAVALSFADATLDFGEDGTALLGGDIAASLVAHSGKVEFQRLHLVSGRCDFNFHGAVGPEPDPPPGAEKPGYRYEFVSDGSTSAPADSPEPALRFLARIAGRYDVQARQLIAAQIGIRTGPGELLGTGSMTFVQGEAPAIFLAVTVPAMPVQHLKQLWPWMAAPGARRWVLANVFGGEVRNSNLQFHVAAGRLGNGVPLGDNEVSGHFEVRKTRFDIVGSIPPVRDGDGVVDFKGTSVDIGLSAGTVYLPSGRTVAASNGVFLLRKVHSPPVIGALDIDIAGDAQAVTELASYDPINAMRHLDMKPEDFSGDVSGHVTAQIPISREVLMRDLDWKVSLSYKGLDVAKSFDGQTVTDADGTITVEPDRAIVDARGRLNGIPADIDLVEPLGRDGPERQRKIVLDLDDKTRDSILPGLSDMLSGPVSVLVDASSDEGQSITADLTKARLTIPWAGWSKGAGIPANVRFHLDMNGKAASLTGFRLTGKSFDIAGAIDLLDGNLTKARFGSVKLNAGDDFLVDVDRSEGGYRVRIKGNSLDARSLIKHVMSDEDAGAATTAGGKPVSVALDANVDSVSGFGDEALHGVTVSYRATGSTVDALSISGTTDSGAAVSLTDGDDSGRRTVTMQSANAGDVLRFLDIYGHMQGGNVKLSLAGQGNGPLAGRLAITDFLVVDEPKLRSIVATPPAGGDGRSLDDAVATDLDVSKVSFELGSARIEKGPGYLRIAQGVLRGPTIGTTFQGTAYDRNGNMDMTGTFMPAYGLNRIFGEIPIFGGILGNGRDRGLIGITYRLSGDAKSPKMQVNPLSAVAPGIFRSIFEFR